VCVCITDSLLGALGSNKSQTIEEMTAWVTQVPYMGFRV